MSDVEMIDAKCKKCGAPFRYFGAPQWYCSTFCRYSDPDNAGEKRAGDAWHREKNRTFQVSLQKKQAKEQDTSLVARGDHQRPSLGEGTKTESATSSKTKISSTRKDERDIGLTTNIGPKKTSVVEKIIKPTEKIETKSDHNIEESTQKKKTEDTENGITTIRTKNMTEGTKESSKQTSPISSSQSLEVSKVAVLDSIEALTKSGSAIMERLEDAKEHKNTQMVCQCAKELRETIRTSLELSKFVFSVSKKQ